MNAGDRSSSDWATVSGKETEKSGSDGSGSSTWTSKLSSDGSTWVLSDGSGSDSSSGYDNYSLVTDGNFSDTRNGPWMTGTTHGDSARDNGWSQNSKSTVVGGDWVTSEGSGSGSGSSHDSTDQSGSGTRSFRLPGLSPISLSVTQSAHSGESFQYQTESTLRRDGTWRTTGSGSGNTSQSSVTRQSTNTGTYTRSVAGGSISGTWHISDVARSNLNLDSQASLSSNGVWVLTSGSGSSYSGSGQGQGYSGSGDYELDNQSNPPYTWSMQGHIEEHGDRDTTYGDGATLTVIKGDWAVASAGASGAYDESSGFTDKVTSGTFSNGGLTGTLTHTVTDSYKAHNGFQLTARTDVDGNITGWDTSSGSGTVDSTHKTSWGFSGSGSSSGDASCTLDYSGTCQKTGWSVPGTLTVRGSGSGGDESHLKLTLASNDAWEITSGSASVSDSSDYSESFSGSGSFGIDLAPYGESRLDGSVSLSTRQGNTSRNSSKFTYSNGVLRQTGGSSYANSFASSESSYSGDGHYTGSVTIGERTFAVEGRQSVSGAGDSYQSRTVNGDFRGGKMVKSGSGVDQSSSKANYSYSGEGSYSTFAEPDHINDLARLDGTAHESGSDDFSCQYKTKYKLDGEVWLASSAQDGTLLIWDVSTARE